ncbi:Putative teichuronic acid biosynthesis glycosyltransferase TuaH [Stieleria maiorica]|uniref:Teichuronic acid biosynthesis glycosyltransferase TuaH n=1 Tax=Stieleria maiorica TaxID=2795974 RepID=A0A5B9MD73_9BACT|nr:glycosyltransferase [Stieleria maiorica]QEF98723.1 Putative teichuronic acid biosynthesis glycosyltransferase TuaH [Stieleria maiorica]
MKMCHAYATLGHDVQLVVPDHQEGIEADVEDVHAFYGVPRTFEIVKVRSFRPLKFWYAIILSLFAIRNTRADLYHTRISWTAWGLSTLFRRPTILELHEVPIDGSLESRCIFHATRQKQLRYLIAITKALKERLADVTHSSCEVVVAADGVDARLATSSLSQLDAKNEVGVGEGQGLTAVYAGHLYPGRGIEVVVEMASRNPAIAFHVIGGREEDIRQWRSKVQHLKNVRFEGFVPPKKVYGYLRAADILLMPYANKVGTSGRGDTAAVCSPMKMFEYMAAGRPILSSDLPVLQEVLRPDVNCLIAPYGDIDRWVSQLKRLEQDAQLRMRLGDQARRDVMAYTWEARAEKLLAACAFQPS